MKRILLSVALLAVVAVVSFAATRAFFSDTEVSAGNIFTAGSIDLKVDHTKQTYNGVDCDTCGVTLTSGTHVQVTAANPGVASVPTNAVLVSSLHPDWVAAPAGASWVWVTDPTATADKSNNATYTFEENFSWTGSATGVSVDILADNSFRLSLNGDVIVNRLDTLGNFNPGYELTPAELTAFLAALNPGVNTLSVEVRNAAGNTGPTQNPGGLAYRIEIEGNCNDPDLWTCELWEEKDLENEKFWQFHDIKPGDSGTNVISLHVYDNDAWACMLVHDGIDDENGLMGPELDLGDDDSAGELQNYINVFAWRDLDGDGIYEPTEETSLGETTLGNLGSIASFDSSTGEYLAGEETAYIGFAWCAGTLNVNHTTGAISCDGSSMLNDAQSDSFSASLTAYAVQHRHNPNFLCSEVDLEAEQG